MGSIFVPHTVQVHFVLQRDHAMWSRQTCLNASTIYGHFEDPYFTFYTDEKDKPKSKFKISIKIEIGTRS